LLIGYKRESTAEEKFSILTDLSVGGVRFTTDEQISLGESLTVQIKIPWDDSTLNLATQIKRCEPIPNSKSFQVGGEFVDLYTLSLKSFTLWNEKAV